MTTNPWDTDALRALRAARPLFAAPQPRRVAPAAAAPHTPAGGCLELLGALAAGGLIVAVLIVGGDWLVAHPPSRELLVVGLMAFCVWGGYAAGRARRSA